MPSGCYIRFILLVTWKRSRVIVLALAMLPRHVATWPQKASERGVRGRGRGLSLLLRGRPKVSPRRDSSQHNSKCRVDMFCSKWAAVHYSYSYKNVSIYLIFAAHEHILYQTPFAAYFIIIWQHT